MELSPCEDVTPVAKVVRTVGEMIPEKYMIICYMNTLIGRVLKNNPYAVEAR